MKFDPELYTITIRKENHEGDYLYVARVIEFPNLSAFEETYEEAHSIILDAISSLKEIADEEGAVFPLPNPITEDEYSGRITLRLPKTLHAKIAKQAEIEDVSLNTYLVGIISSYSGESDGISKMLSGAIFQLGSFIHAQQVAFHQVLNSFSVYSTQNQLPNQTKPILVSASSGYLYG